MVKLKDFVEKIAYSDINKIIKKILRHLLLLTFMFSPAIQANAQQQLKKVKAQKGDGIYSLLRKNGIPAASFNEFVKLNKGNLGSNNQLKTGTYYYLPGTSSVTKSSSGNGFGVYPIFGKEKEKVEYDNNMLQGAVFYLVSGHGGLDPGAVGKYNGKELCEDEYAYDVTLRLAHNLIQHRATVYMITRDKNDGIRDGWYLPDDEDETCYPSLRIPSKQSTRLRQRKDAVNKLYKKHKGKYQRLIVTHVDSRSRGENIDVFFYYDQRSKSGKKLCYNLRNTFDKKYKQHQPGRGYKGTVSARNLYMLKYSWPVATYIELGNINHKRDQQRFIKYTNRQALANWLFEGLVLDYKNNR